MAWITGYKIDGGALAGSVFEGGGGDLDDATWVNYPDPSATGFTVASGVDMTAVWGGVACMNLLKEKAVGDEFTLWSIDIIDPNEYKVELIFKMRCFRIGGFECSLIRRVYTDETTYNDTTLAGRSLGFYFNDPNLNTTKVNAVFFQSSYNGNSFFYIGFSWQDEIYWSGETTCSCDGFSIPFAKFADVLGGNPTGEEYSPEFGPGAGPEGYDGGSFDDHSDVVDFPTDPQSILGLGFINVYKCSANSLVDFGAALFPEITWPQSLTEVGEVIAAVSDSIWNSKLIDYVISVHCVPGDVPAGALEDIKVGARTMTGILARKITKEYVTFDFGSIQTGRVFKNYADIMTGCKVFLPFYGFVPLPAEYWNGCTLTLRYKFNVIDGSFLAYLKASDCYYSKLNGVIGQYGGSAVVHMPTTGANYASMFANVIGSGAKLASGIASGNVGKVASSAVSIAANIGGGGDTQGSESYNASSSFMSMRTPFLLIELPVPQFPTKYAPEKGLPANISYVLGTLSGLVICDSPRITFACTEDEQKEIIAALREGIII